MTLQPTITSPIRQRRWQRRRWLFIAAAAALAAGVASALLAVSVGTGGESGALSAKSQQYVDAVASMTPAQLKAAFGTGPVDAIDALGLSPKAEQYVRAITAMTPTQLRAGFGTADAIDALGLSPKAEQYVREITSLTPAQLRAGFGTAVTPTQVAAPMIGSNWPSYGPAVTPMVGSNWPSYWPAGRAAVLASLTPRELRYVASIMALTPEQLAAGAAGFGTGR
jgi:hypothetical protein